MKVTKELLKELYIEYNQTYFDGVLGDCEFHLFPKTTGFLGAYRNHVDRKGKLKDRIWRSRQIILLVPQFGTITI